MNKGTLRFMQKEVKFKGTSGFMVECCFLSFTNNYHSSANFHSNEKNKISESKSKSHLLKAKDNFINQTKGFPLLLIKCMTPGAFL